MLIQELGKHCVVPQDLQALFGLFWVRDELLRSQTSGGNASSDLLNVESQWGTFALKTGRTSPKLVEHRCACMAQQALYWHVLIVSPGFCVFVDRDLHNAACCVRHGHAWSSEDQLLLLTPRFGVVSANHRVANLYGVAHELLCMDSHRRLWSKRAPNPTKQRSPAAGKPWQPRQLSSC